LRDVNNVWINAAFNISESRFNTSQHHLSVGVSTVRFPDPAIDVINRHIAAQTAGMIPAALSRDCIKAETAFLITNALYFHGEWVTKFDLTNTRSEPFTRFDDSTIDTQIMQVRLKIPYGENDHAQLVFLPYKDSSCEFVAILPRKNTEADFRRALTAIDSSWFDSCRRGPVRLRLPKFRVRGPTLSFNVLSSKLGLKEVFETHERIFPQAEGEPPLAMGDIQQRVVIEVDESGTRAAVASLSTFAARGPRPPPEVRIDFDRPFAYLVRDRVSGTILIMGTYLDPAAHGATG
jgi:serpin B